MGYEIICGIWIRREYYNFEMRNLLPCDVPTHNKQNGTQQDARGTHRDKSRRADWKQPTLDHGDTQETTQKTGKMALNAAAAKLLKREQKKKSQGEKPTQLDPARSESCVSFLGLGLDDVYRRLSTLELIQAWNICTKHQITNHITNWFPKLGLFG